jgi:hypothetical protein
VSAVIHLEATPVSLLDILLAASTELAISDLMVDSSFDGQTCLVAGDQSALTEAVFGLLHNTKRTSGPGQRYSASVQATGETVTLTLCVAGGSPQWSLQFPELHPES